MNFSRIFVANVLSDKIKAEKNVFEVRKGKLAPKYFPIIAFSPMFNWEKRGVARSGEKKIVRGSHEYFLYMNVPNNPYLSVNLKTKKKILENNGRPKVYSLPMQFVCKVGVHESCRFPFFQEIIEL